MKTRIGFLLVALLALLLASCGGSPQVQDQPVADYYQESCAGCHGPERQGDKAPPLLPETLDQDDEFYFNIIQNGEDGMPAYGDKISEEEINILIDFIQAEP